MLFDPIVWVTFGLFFHSAPSVPGIGQREAILRIGILSDVDCRFNTFTPLLSRSGGIEPAAALDTTIRKTGRSGMRYLRTGTGARVARCASLLAAEENPQRRQAGNDTAKGTFNQSPDTRINVRICLGQNVPESFVQ